MAQSETHYTSTYLVPLNYLLFAYIIANKWCGNITEIDNIAQVFP